MCVYVLCLCMCVRCGVVYVCACVWCGVYVCVVCVRVCVCVRVYVLCVCVCAVWCVCGVCACVWCGVYVCGTCVWYVCVCVCVGSTFGSVSLTGCLPTNLVTHSAGRLYTHFPLNCCRIHKVQSTCYQAHHTIHSLYISFGSWLHLSHVDHRGDHICTFHELITPSRVKDASSLNKMTLNSSG